MYMGQLFGRGLAVLAASENRYLLGGVDNAAEFEKMFSVLQTALAANDRGKVADLVLYPLRVNGWLGDAAGKTTVQFLTPRRKLWKTLMIFLLCR